MSRLMIHPRIPSSPSPVSGTTPLSFATEASSSKTAFKSKLKSDDSMVGMRSASAPLAVDACVSGLPPSGAPCSPIAAITVL